MEMSKKNKLKLFRVCAYLAVAFGMIIGMRDAAHTKDNATAVRANAYEGQFTYFINDSTPLQPTTSGKVIMYFTSRDIEFNGIQVSTINNDLRMYFFKAGMEVPQLVYSVDEYGGWIDNGYRQLKMYNANFETSYLASINYFQSDTASYVIINGWYTFNSSIQVNNISSLRFTSAGKFFTNISRDTSNNLFYQNIDYKGDVLESVQVYTSGVGWVKEDYRLLYFNASTITSSNYNYFSQFGVFEFTNLTSTSSFGDLILSFADVPIYTITGLMSFELFGVELYIAFGSLIMLLVILKVVRLFL